MRSGPVLELTSMALGQCMKAGSPIFEYEPNTWGPNEVDQRVAPPGGWHNPIMAG